MKTKNGSRYIGDFHQVIADLYDSDQKVKDQSGEYTVLDVTIYS